ncbi:alanine racemase [Achromobacter xylosoxidans]|uniref:alanine racemase n=1 Tax=Alcaligenes xylosoxydans xylosoxydans TaxID=85698 RepID=UPI0008A222AE|nr:alanine racemase [Achromobacter xylosoxidans]OFU61656.1 alanine racemase [Achromobacter xylosoxidans]QEQ21533.1 alanine racemase [Achromobacter xylosoxidans]
MPPVNAPYRPEGLLARPLHARVDASAVAHNLARLRAALPDSDAPRLWATVKADAYGHGLARVLPALRDADGLAVLHLDEARACRQLGWNGPVLVYGGLYSPADTLLLDTPDLHLVITHAAQLQWLAQSPARERPAIWLRFAGDIHHTGFCADDYRAAFEQARQLAARGLVGEIGHLNHYARADEADGVGQADAHFREVVRGLPGPVSTSNSAAVLGHAGLAAGTQWVRPGLALYGASPFADRSAAQLALRPAMSLHSQVVGIQRVRAGAGVGYSGAFVAPATMDVGIVTCGYADGYPRHAPTGTPVMVAGVRTRLLGRVSMDMMAVDLDPIPQAAIGSPVTLWGADGPPVEEVAMAAGTIAAQLLTGLSARVPVALAGAAR